MILAAAASADEDGTPPPELLLAWQMDRYHALPRAGGLLDQPAQTMRRAAAARNAYDAIKASHRMNANEFAQTELYPIWQEIWSMRIQQND